MYHTQIKNQALNTSFSQKDFHTAMQDVNNLTLTEQRIYQHLWRYRHYPSVKFKNETIAKRIGCTVRTVQKATAKFHKAGLITKKQQDIYSPNQYTFQCELFIPYKSLILEDSLFINSYPILESSYSSKLQTHAREASVKDRFRKNISKKGNVVNFEVKQLVRQYRNDPQMKEYLTSASVREMIIGTEIFKISNLLELDDNEYFRLTPFSEEALAHAFSEIEPIVTGDRVLKYAINDRMAWLMSLLIKYCKDNDIKPDWKWYYDLCDIIGMNPKSEFAKKPLKSQQVQPKKPIQNLSFEEQLRRIGIELKQREERFSIYGGSLHDKKTIASLKQQIEEKNPTKGKKQEDWQEMQQIVPLQARVEKWKLQIQTYKQFMTDFPSNGYGGTGYLERMLWNAERELGIAEDKLKEVYEKENLASASILVIS